MVVERAFADYTDFRIPGIVATERGSLIRYCECRKARGDWAAIDLKIARSADGGESWQTVMMIEGDGHTLNNPVAFVDGDRLIFLYCKDYKEIWKRVSTDDGVSFSDPQRVDFEESVDFFYNVVAVGPGHGIVHRGRLIVPVWFAYNEQDAKSHHPSFISTLFSDDGGESWRVGEPIFKDLLVNPSECALAVTAEDELLISIRHEGEQKARGLAKSADGVSGWCALRFEAALADPICMGSMTHRDGVIWHVNCDSESERKNLTVKVSRDGFEHVQSIPISRDGGYSDIALLGGKLCVFYEKRYDALPYELFFDVIEADI